MTEAEIHLTNPAKLFRQTEPALSKTGQRTDENGIKT